MSWAGVPAAATAGWSIPASRSAPVPCSSATATGVASFTRPAWTPSRSSRKRSPPTGSNAATHGVATSTSRINRVMSNISKPERRSCEMSLASTRQSWTGTPSPRRSDRLSITARSSTNAVVASTPRGTWPGWPAWPAMAARSSTTERRPLPSRAGRPAVSPSRHRGGTSPRAKARDWLYAAMIRVHPQLAGVMVEHAWGGNVGFTFDRLPHISRIEGITYALGYCGTGVAMSTYFGQLAADWIGGGQLPDCWQRAFPSLPLYRETPWFLPAICWYYAALDRL